MQNKFITERLTMEPVTIDDHAFITALVNSKGWIDFIGDRHVHTKEEAVAYINKILAAENLYYWVVRKKDDNKAAGIISFIKRNYLDHFDIGFAFLPEFYGYGYAYESASAVLAVLGREYHPILATTLPSNTNSIKLLIKLGFHFQKKLMVEKEELHIYSNSTQQEAVTAR